MLKKQNRLGKTIKKTKGVTFTSPLLNLKISDNEEHVSRFRFVISKKISKKAVVRNRIKRILSKIIEEDLEKIKKGKNIIFILKKEIKQEEKEEIKKAIKAILARANVLKSQ